MWQRNAEPLGGSPGLSALLAAATGMTAADESRLFHFTIRHSVLLMAVMGLLSLFFAYVMP